MQEKADPMVRERRLKSVQYIGLHVLHDFSPETGSESTLKTSEIYHGEIPSVLDIPLIPLARSQQSNMHALLQGEKAEEIPNLKNPQPALIQLRCGKWMLPGESLISLAKLVRLINGLGE